MSAGMIACAAFTCSVSAAPSRNAHEYNIHSSSAPTAIAMPNAPTMTKRMRSAPIISRRRSIRSANAPVSIEKNSHGSRDAIVTPAISTGSRVSVAASSGKAVTNMPSPVLDTMTDIHTSENGRPNDRLRRRLSSDATVVTKVVDCRRRLGFLANRYRPDSESVRCISAQFRKASGLVLTSRLLDWRGLEHGAISVRLGLERRRRRDDNHEDSSRQADGARPARGRVESHDLM